MYSRSTYILFSGFFFLSLIFTTIPLSADAALVPCGRNAGTVAEMAPCTLCHIIIGGKGIIDWGLGIMTVVAIAVIVAMAIFYIVSIGNEGMMSTAKSGIKASLVGFAVILSAWLIVNVVLTLLVNNDFLSGIKQGSMFTFTCDTTSSTVTNGTTGTGATGTEGATGGSLPVGCTAYQSDFATASDVSGVPANLLQSIASAESSCDPNKTSSTGSCGLMQLTPATVGVSCQDLKDDPKKSIQLAANYLKTLQGNLNAYNETFDIGNSFALSGSTVTVQSANYDGGNDDLIASYNAGSGNRSNAGGQKGPFMVSTDCPAISGGKSIPAWQCPINPGGFAETQTYVKKVQALMRP